MERVAVLCPRLKRLHARLDHTDDAALACRTYYERRTNALERHRGVHGHEACNRADAEGDAAGQGLPRAGAAQHGLLERRVCREADGRIGTLPHHLWDRLSGTHDTYTTKEQRDARRERVRDKYPGSPPPALWSACHA